MAVCNFFLQGRCRFGGEFLSIRATLNAVTNGFSERCKNEHPGQATMGSSGNRFGALSGGGGFGGTFV